MYFEYFNALHGFTICHLYLLRLNCFQQYKGLKTGILVAQISHPSRLLLGFISLNNYSAISIYSNEELSRAQILRNYIGGYCDLAEQVSYLLLQIEFE